MQANIQIPFYTELNLIEKLTQKFSNSFYNIYIPVYWFGVFSVEYIFAKYYTHQFRKKYAYSELKKIHTELNEIIASIKIRSEASPNEVNWFTRKIIFLYSNLSEMLENKRKQENLFISEMIASLNEADTLTNGAETNTIKKMTKQLEHAL